MSKARDIANSTETLDVDGGTIKLDGNYPTNTGNVALGDTALDSLGAGNYNTAVGHNALTANTDGSNTAFGAFSLAAVTTGGNNVAVGREALEANTGDGNTSVGYQALTSNTTASNNTAVGYQAGYSNTTGSYNTFIGRSAGTNTTGGENTFVGSSAGNLVTTGQKNTILGKFDGNAGGLDIRTSSNNIVLADGDGNPRLRVHSSGAISFGSQNGDINIPGGAVGLALNGADGLQLLDSRTNSSISTYRYRFYNTNGLVGYISTGGSSTNFVTSSDYRLKENVVALTDATTRLKQLEPKRFNFIADADTTVDGFIAHEVQSIVPEAVTGEKDAVDADGNIAPQGIDQAKLVPLLVATIKELEARITALEAD